MLQPGDVYINFAGNLCCVYSVSSWKAYILSYSGSTYSINLNGVEKYLKDTVIAKNSIKEFIDNFPKYRLNRYNRYYMDKIKSLCKTQQSPLENINKLLLLIIK